MTSHSESRIVPYPADLMFSIVADVERYPEFVPWVTALRIKKRERDGDRDILLAETVVGFKALRERYTSRVVLDRAQMRIDVSQTEGVFRVLENHWRFTPLDVKSCRVDFRIEFEFKSKLLGAVAGSAFGLVVSQMTHAFEARAKQLSQQTLQ
ncbi:MAG: type II toxin-antitoxin system RatA family toxin [Rhizomicrobium sp.]